MFIIFAFKDSKRNNLSLKKNKHESQSRLCKYYWKAKCRKINAYERICRIKNFYSNIESAEHNTSYFGHC